MKLGDATNAGTGTFEVVGSGISQIGLGAANDDIDATWEQYAGSTLRVLVDGGGCTPIFIQDNSGTTGTSATFESGALLDVGFVGSGPGGVGGTWTVMEVENGEIADNGLAFAPGVDTSVWSFAIDNTGSNGLLTVTSTYSNADLNVYWDGSESTAWEDPLNWTNGFGVFQNAYVQVSSGTIDYTAASERDLNIRGFRMSGGTINISGGTLKATARASDLSVMNGTTNQTGGYFDVNALEIGSLVGSNAVYTLTDGELKIGRANNGVSLYLGANRSNSNAGDGTLAISGGRFTSRNGVELGDAAATGTGRFAVLGTEVSEVGIAAANDDTDGFWIQNSGSVLEVGIDFGGVTPIVIKDSETNTTGTSATFENGSLLDVHYHNITEGGGTWVVMEVENGDIIDNGLQFAPGVDTSVWSFAVDNSGSNGRLLVSAIGDPLGYDLVVGNTPQQKMRYGMDYERLWYWTGGLNGSERDQIARWTAVDADVDFVRVAMNSGYELTENSFDLSAYTNKIIPLMQEMKQANPDIKFFASPRPLNEAVSGASWQPYPLWVTDPGETDYTNTSYDFNDIKCAEYIVKYLLLMKAYGFRISFLDVTNEWQDNVGGGRLTQDDMDDIHEYLHVTYMAAPWEHPSGLYPGITLAPEDIPEIVAPSSWNYDQGTKWINNLDSGDKEAISIAASHNTDRDGDAQSFAEAVHSELGTDTEIWNTELHGWKSTSGENETTSFYYYIEAIRAGFGGINGWLAIGTTNQGHSYILNPSGTPKRNVKYYIYRKLASTSNYGYALDILEEPEGFGIPLGSNDDDIPRNVAAFIKGNLMTVWVVNESTDTVPIVVTPSGRTIAESTVRRTRWTDPADVEGFVTYEYVNGGTSFGSSIPGESVCCFEIVLGPEDFSYDLIQAEDYSHQWGTGLEDQGSYVNVSNVNNGEFTRYGGVALDDNSIMQFSVARPAGRPDGIIEIREGSYDGPLLGQVSVPETGHWQIYQTVSTQLDVDAGIYNLYLKYVEDSEDPTGNYLFNIDWFTVNSPLSVPGDLEANASGPSQIDLTWSAVPGATGYVVKRSETSGGPYTVIASDVSGTSYSDTGVVTGVSYYYVVRALYNGEESDDSDEVVATTVYPAAPTGLTVVAQSATEAVLSWDEMPGADVYVVKRSTTSGSGFDNVGGSTATSYTNASLTPGTRYYYTVFAIYGTVYSEDSEEVSVVPSDPIVAENVVISSMNLDDDGGGGLEWTFSIEQSGLGQFYQLEASESLEDGTWQVVSPVKIGNGGLLEFEYPYEEVYKKRFFRVEVWRE